MSLSGVNFNSHAHVERDYQQRFQDFPLLISTHTLTWSVTLIGHERFKDVFAFQLTRSRGAWHDWLVNTPYGENFNSHAHVERDKVVGSNPAPATNFNSHAHVERDLKFVFFNFLGIFISTHTLTWSVTFYLYNKNTEEKFQLTRSRGAWRISIPMTGNDSAFQLTRSRGAWQVLKHERF